MIRAILFVAALAGCKKGEDKPWLPDPTAPAPMSETELKRGKDACTEYATKICACADAHADRKDVAEACKLGKGYPEAIDMGMSIATGSDSVKRDVVQSQDAVRKTMKKCIEEAGKLSLLGC